MVLAPIIPAREEELRDSLKSMNESPGIVDPYNVLVPFGRFSTLHFARFVILNDQTTGDVGVYDLPTRKYPLYLASLWTRVRLREELKHAANDLDPDFLAIATESGAPGRQLYYECFANLGLLGAFGGTFLLVCQKPGTRRS